MPVLLPTRADPGPSIRPSSRPLALDRPGHWRELALLLVLATLWGASYTLIKLGVATIPPVTLIAGRTLIAAAILLAVLRMRRIAMPRDGATWLRFLVQAWLNSVVPFTLIAWAELTVEAGIATILNSTTPLFAFLLTWAVTRHEAVSGRKLIGVLLGLGGTCLVVGVEAFGGLGRDPTAQLAIVLATVSYAGAAIFGKSFNGLDPMIPAAGSLLTGGVLLLPVSLMVDRPWTLTPSAGSVAALLCLSVFSTALAFAIYFRLIQTLGSVGTTVQAYLRVPAGVAIGILVLGESLSPTAGAGLVLVVLGVAVATMPGRLAGPARAR